jgi:hypothetical protein
LLDTKLTDWNILIKKVCTIMERIVMIFRDYF